MIDCEVNKNLKIGDHISFHLGTDLIDGYIKEKTPMDCGEIGFLIETEDGKLCRKQHRKLDLHYIYNK